MEHAKLMYFYALQDFQDARRKASIEDLLARLRGRSSELLSYEEVAEKLKLRIRTESGIHDIPIKAIIGSVGRYTEFTRDFLPRGKVDQQRWARVKAAIDNPVGEGVPPIDVYKVGDVYFVLDGNHRVSVARQEGFEYINAHIIEVQTDIQLTPDIQPDDLIIKAEYASFLEKTDFANICPGMDLNVSVPGQYERLLEHIEVHRYFMGIDLQRDITYPEALRHWHDVVYTSIVEPIRERGLLRWFPGRTETDIYLWVSAYRANLESELGLPIRPELVAEKLAIQENPRGDLSDTGGWRSAKMNDRYMDRLFGELLVPITGQEESWQALEQAIIVAKKDSSLVHGLHVISPDKEVDSIGAQEIQARFDQRCQEANLVSNLVIRKGSVSREVRNYALLTDLIVLNVLHPPLPGFSGLRSGLRSIIKHTARPILTVTRNVSTLDNALLAFDGSPKSKEALFVAAYLAEKWHTKLTVMTLAGAGDPGVQNYARSYLELHEIQADYLVKSGPPEIFLEIIKERLVNLVIIGSYSGTALKEAILGSVVNFLLRKVDCSLLICK